MKNVHDFLAYIFLQGNSQNEEVQTAIINVDERLIMLDACEKYN